ncbi:MAG: hypothetical protein JNJ94_06400 [Chlorobi bacterium]|nr:hypothetical protein [Chlorobiota bacterium]
MPLLQIEIDTDTLALLQSAGERSISRYLNAIIQDRHDESASALSHLNFSGWDGAAVVAACDALCQLGAMATMPLMRPLTISVPQSLRNHAQSAIERHGIAPYAWEAMEDQCSDEPSIALAAWIAAREYWSGNMSFRSIVLASKATRH